MKLIAIRHLPTEWNQRGVLQGSFDVPVLAPTDAMLERIEQNKQLLKPFSIDAVLASPMQRTQQTAQAYGFYDFTVEPLLNELNFGQYEGQPKQQMIEAIGDDWFNNPENVVLGEPLTGLAERVEQFFKKYSRYKTLLAFTHGSWTRAALSLAQHNSLLMMNQIAVENNQLYQLEFNAIKTD